MNEKKWMYMIFLMCISLLFSACGNDGDKTRGDASEAPTTASSASASAATQPVTLTVARPIATFTDEEIKKFIEDPVTKKYPHITIKWINTSEKGQSIQDLVTAGKIPDIYGGQQSNFAPLRDLELDYNISDLVKKHNIDLNRIQPELMEGIKHEIGLQNLSGLPLFQSNWALVYNKTFFDRFGAAYPKDGMTWEEVGELTKKLSRVDGGGEYWGLSMARTITDVYKQIALPFADFKTNKPLMQSQGFKDLFGLWVDIYKQNGSPPNKSDSDWNKWFDQGQVGMKTASTSTFQAMLANKDMVWDVVTYPQNKHAPGVGMEMNAHWWMVTRQSANKDAAIQILTVALSNEIQTLMSRGLRISVLKDSAIQNQIGADIAGTQGKNVVAYTKLKTPFPIQKENLASTAGKVRDDAFASVLYNGRDINTALREADEGVDKLLQQRLQK